MSTMGLWQIFDMILKIIYLLLRPLLVVAGLALDNTLVYASIFHLDAPLWKFWNMMKNFANFTLWFMVLFAIIKSIITNTWGWSDKDEKSPLGIIKKTLIAGVLIQASWFLVAALVDVSTIATYAVGGLPLSVLKNTPIGNQKILSVNSSINLNKFDVLNKKWESFKVRYSTTYNGKAITMSPCKVEKSYVIGREFGDVEYRNSDKFKGDAKYEWYEVCVLFGNQLVMRKEDEFMAEIETKTKISSNYKASAAGYKTTMDALLNFNWWENTERAQKYAVNIKSWSTQAGFVQWKSFFDSTTSMTISDLIKKSKWFVGPLVTMYSSLLNFAQLTDTNITTVGETSGVFLIKTWVAIALFFPLIALAIVLIARIGVLRLYIVASPFIILKASFSKFLEMKGLDEYLDIKSVIGIIFAPVVTVAALSISLIFMTALVNGFSSSGSNEQINQTLGIEKIQAIEPGNDAVNFQNVAQLEFTKLPWWEAMDRFSRLMINFFAIGLMRMVFFAAIKANKLGKGIGGKVQEFWSNVFRTLPILPIGEGGAGVGFGSAAREISRLPDTYISNVTANQNEEVKKRLGEGNEWGGGGNVLTSTQVSNIIASAPGRTAEQITAAVTKETWVSAQNAPGIITGNEKIFYEQIRPLAEGPEKQSRIEAIGKAGGNIAWYDNMLKAEATTNFEAIVKIESKDASVPELTKTVNDSVNKKVVEDLFAANPAWYSKEIDGVRFTITKNTDPKAANKYVVESKTM